MEHVYFLSLCPQHQQVGSQAVVLTSTISTNGCTNREKDIERESRGGWGAAIEPHSISL